MKRLIITTLISFLLAIPFTSTQINAKMPNCERADAASRGKERRSITVTDFGVYNMLINVGECRDNICVIAETYGDCGFITQLIDMNRDGRFDYSIEWQSIVDPTYGVFFTVCKISNT